MNLLNCTTNPIISNNLLDSYKKLDIEYSGEGIMLDVSEIDFTGVLNRNPFSEKGSKFYFDTENYNASSIYKSKDFNAFLWYIINKSDKSQKDELVWDNRYRANLWGNGNGKRKEIIKCTYIDEEYPNTDKIKVQLCGSNYFKTRKIKMGAWEQLYNKTIFEFNHEFLTSIKLYEPKVIVAEIVEYLLGSGNISVNFGFSINEEIVQGKIQQIIKNIIETSDLEINDCYFSFSNEEYNEMLEKSERNRFNIVNGSNGTFQANPINILNQLSGITSNSTLHEDKTIINKTLNDVIATPAQDPSATISDKLSYDWQFELLRMLVYPFVRPLFTPKVIFLLLVNKKIMGNLDDISSMNGDKLIDSLYNSIFHIIRDIIIQLKDLLVEMLLSYILKKLAPLISLCASRLLMETLQVYKDLLNQILENCAFGWNNNPLIGNIDNVNYADIIPTQVEPNQSIC